MPPPPTTDASVAFEEEKEEINSSNALDETHSVIISQLDEQTGAITNISSAQDDIFDGFNGNEVEISDRSERVSPLFTSVSSMPPISNLTNNNESNLSDNNFSESRWSKQRASINAESELGASYVPERAPNLNLRFFRRTGRRNASRRRRGDANSNGDVQMGDSRTRPMSNIMYEDSGLVASVRRMNSRFVSSLGTSGFAHSFGSQNESPQSSGLQSDARRASAFRRLSNYLISATLVEENAPIEVVEARPVGFCQQNWKAVASFSFIMLVAFVTLMALTFTRIGFWGNVPQPTPMPSSAPSTQPSFDPRSTFEIVQERGKILCGLYEGWDEGSFRHQLCQAVAAVVLNNPNALEIVNVTSDTRFVMLDDRVVDLLAGGDTYTIEREVYEPSTGSSFTFSAPYYYDGMGFGGNETYVKCAEEQKRYGECSGLSICVTGSTTNSEYVADHFTSDFFMLTRGLSQSLEHFSNGSCNVVAESHLGLLGVNNTHGGLIDATFIIGNITFNNDPLAFVTRPDDTEWSNIVNWALQALFFGERQGISKNESMCQSAENLSEDWSELIFLNAVYCVGNYAEIYNKSELAKAGRSTINTINNGTAMLYVIPYGHLDRANPKKFNELSKTFAGIKNSNILNCGLLAQDGFVSEDNITGSRGLFGMGVSFCETLASSMLHGNIGAANFTTFQSVESSLVALNTDEVDVLFGAPADMSVNVGNQGFEGVTFSTPYYYGNETGKSDVSFYPIMTRQDDVMFSSFVNCIVLSTLYAQSKNIDKKNSYIMPSISLFGNDMMWSLKDTISAHGNYGEIYYNNFGAEQSEGRNDLNSDGPELLDMPGIGLTLKEYS